jgi:pimeloyl-ACP methyl ester carboxylesterase
MDGWQSGDVEANGIRLHYTRTGGTKPPLVLAHGATEAGPCWTPVAEALAPDYDVVMVDARGHGRSEAPGEGYDPITQAADLAGLVAALGLHRPAILGHSMGAVTTLVLAGTYPDVPRAILLEDPGAWWAGWPATPEERQGLAELRARSDAYRRQTREELIAANRARHPDWAEAERAPWAEAKLRVSPAALTVFEPATAATVDWPAVLGRVACPALLIMADPALGGVVTTESAARLQALVPQVRVAHVPGAGHTIRRDQFGRYLEAVRGFLAEQPAP